MFHKIYGVVLLCSLPLLLMPKTLAAQQTLDNSTMMATLRENLPDLRYLMRCTNPDSLKKYYASRPLHDVALRAVYATKLLEIEGSQKDTSLFLQTLPTSEIEYLYLSLLTDRPSGDKQLDSALSDVSEEMPERATKLLPTHRQYIQRFFRYVYATAVDAEISETIPGCSSWLIERECVWFLNELHKANPQIAKYILGGLEMDPPDLSCVEQHRAQIPFGYIKQLEEILKDAKHIEKGQRSE